jgi:hypothetical protein
MTAGDYVGVVAVLHHATQAVLVSVQPSQDHPVSGRFGTVIGSLQLHVVRAPAEPVMRAA